MFGHANPLALFLATHPRISSKTHSRHSFPSSKTQKLARPRAPRSSSRPSLSLLFATHPQNALVSPLVATHFQKYLALTSPSDSPHSHSPLTARHLFLYNAPGIRGACHETQSGVAAQHGGGGAGRP